MNITALLVSTKLEAPITEALPKATLGLRLTLLSAYLHYALGMTTRNICAWLRTFCQFQVTPGGLVLNWQQLAELLSPVYDHLAKAAKLSAVLNLRSAAERTNSTLKDDNAILREPPARSLRRAAVVSQMGVITTLLDRVLRFVIDVTVKQKKFKATGDKHWFDQLSPPEVPAHLKPFVDAA